MENSIIGHSGCCGDIIASLPIARALGSAAYKIFDRPWTKVITSPDRFNYVAPLVRSQPYIESFEICDDGNLTHDVSTFRSGGLEYGKNLADLQADWVGVRISHEPWLTVEPNEDYRGKIVVSRTERYANPYFPWQELITHFQKDAIFIGLPHEHRKFQSEFGVSLPFVATESLLEVAQILAASKLHIGNQSSPINVSVGLGIPFVMEVSLTAPDVIYPRPAAHYVADGGICNLCLEGYDAFNSNPVTLNGEVDWLISPPGGYWKYQTADRQRFSELSATQLIREVSKHEVRAGLPPSSKQDIANYMIGLHPSMERGGYSVDAKRRITQIKEFIAQKNP